jgi:methylase of polypeptide subunit release factors
VAFTRASTPVGPRVLRVLEVSFGTGYLMTQYAGRFETHGVDINGRMVATAKENLLSTGPEIVGW